MSSNYSLLPSAFLKNYITELNKEISDLESYLSSLQLRKKELSMTIEAIDKSSDKQFASFTPFDINHNNDEKVKNLKDEYHVVSSNIDDLLIQISKKRLIIYDFEQCYNNVLELEKK